MAQKAAFSSCAVRRSGGHEEETFEEFSARYDSLTVVLLQRRLGFRGSRADVVYRYEKEFDGVNDVFELQVCTRSVRALRFEVDSGSEI
jgi:hypothetical protein